MGYLPLRDYGLIGNQGSAVLSGRLGSIDWCCLPYLDSASHFGALLDENQGGSFRIAPRGEFRSEQRYLARSNVLETQIEAPNGRAILLDWMPFSPGEAPQPVIRRRVRVLDGEVPWVLQCAPRFAYGSESAHAERWRGGVLFRGHAPGDLALLEATIPITLAENARSAFAEFSLCGGQQADFAWSFGRRSGVGAMSGPEAEQKAWSAVAHRCPEPPALCPFAGPWHDLVVRSSLLLSMMTARYSGAIAEAATTSIPSLTGGARNWDYRYAWLREAAYAAQALQGLGSPEGAQSYFSFVSDLVVRDGAEGLQSVYTLDGGRFLPERELSFLGGYAGSRPVRVGNLAARQFHLDVFGHVMLAAERQFRILGKLPPGLWPKLAEIAEHVSQAWRRPDRGPWEVRSKPEHFVASKVLCWVALDRACSLARALGQRVPNRWLEERATLYRTILEQGYDESRGSFVSAFGSRELDASALLIPLLGFLPPDDPRVMGTLELIQAELAEGVLVHRYRGGGGLPESDGAHLLASFWFASCLALSGRVDEAADRLAELCSYATPLGLFGEQVDPLTGEAAGNFPSTSSHVALVNAAMYVAAARGVSPPVPAIIGFPAPPNLGRDFGMTA